MRRRHGQPLDRISETHQRQIAWERQAMRRGLTLIELLLAIALLSGIVIAAGAWTGIAGHAATRASEPMRLQIAANAALQLIHDDLAVGDFEGPTDPTRPAPSWVSVANG